MDKSEKKCVLSLGGELHAIVLVALSPDAYHNPQRTAYRLVKYKEVESVDILTGNWDLAVEVKTETTETLFDFLKRTISNEGEIAKTNTLISLKRIRYASC
jgi:DNA-binding Lrp family transcriptional regulator